MRYRLRMLLVLLAVPFGLHTLMTGSPIPLWHVEKLVSPVAVKEVSADELLLEDGRHIRLPLISSLPKGNPLFLAAIREGVEVRDDGEVIGLLWVDRSCGNDPFVWTRYRINLSELAVALEPSGIDASIIPPAAIQWLAECDRIEPRAAHPDRLRDISLHHLRHIRGQFEYSKEAVNRVEPNAGFAIPLRSGE
jgi:hypothetical protein